MHGYPVCVIEAKSPDVPAQQAIDEARLYAQLLNQNFPTKINPIGLVVAGCDGRGLVGPVDTNECQRFLVGDIVIGSNALSALRKLLGIKPIAQVAERTLKSLTAQHYTRPTSRLSPQLLLNRVKPNALASYLTPLYEMFFGPRTPKRFS